MTYSWREAPEAEFCVIGEPIAHSLSPKMHQAIYAALGLAYRYVAVHVPVGEVLPALDRLSTMGYIGVNVTVPHKETILKWACDIEAFAAHVGAGNTIRTSDRSCINTDAPGFLDTLCNFKPSRKVVLLLGAGGSARAIGFALLSAGFEVKLHNRTRDKALSLAKLIGLPFNQVLDSANPSGAGLIVNTTSASLANEDLSVRWELAERGAMAYDLAYSTHSTPFLLRAAEHGLLTMDGRPLLVAQGARSFEWWTGLAAPREAMLTAIS